jgi:hypothetical protein
MLALNNSEILEGTHICSSYFGILNMSLGIIFILADGFLLILLV